MLSLKLTSNDFLISGSDDLSIALFDLKKSNENEALEMIFYPDDSAIWLFELNDFYFAYEGLSN